MTIRGMLAGLGKGIKWGLIALALVYVTLLAINAVDEAPSPELQTILRSPKIDADPDNGYLAFVGSMQAPEDEDIFDYGTRWVDAYNAAADSAAIERANTRFKTIAPSFLGDQKLLCNPSRIACLTEAGKHADVWRKLAADNDLLLARQRSLTEFPHFEESYFPPSIASPITPYANPARLLALDMIALDAAEGRLEPALVALEARIAFDRRVLLSSRLLITGMVARSWLGQDYALLAEIVATRAPVLAAQQARLYRITAPLEINQIRAIAGRLYEGEARFQARKLHEVFSLGNQQGLADKLLIMLARPGFKSRTTLNLLARKHAALQAHILTFSPENADAWALQASRAEPYDAAAFYAWRTLYNPVGNYVISIGGVGVYGYERYMLKLSDLIGITRLARLQAEIVTAGETDVGIPAYLAANQAWYDPYTGKPMGWDAVKRQLYFDARGDAPQGISKHIQAGL